VREFFSLLPRWSHNNTRTTNHQTKQQQQEHGVAPGALLLLERAAAARPRAADETARSGRGGKGRGGAAAAADDDSDDDEQEETEDVWAPALAASLCEQVSFFSCWRFSFPLSRARPILPVRCLPPPHSRLGRETHLFVFCTSV
jgi:hypothetical protein